MLNNFILGGVRSGKSDWGLRHLQATQPPPYQLIVTADDNDPAFAKRIDRHQRQRQQAALQPMEPIGFWQVHAAPYQLNSCLLELTATRANLKVKTASNPTAPATICIDGIDVWLNNCLYRHPAKQHDWYWEKFIAPLLQQLTSGTGNINIISSEVGMGLLPDNALARIFTDLLGEINQELRQLAVASFLIVAGAAISLSAPSAAAMKKTGRR